ncbi:heterokaryon incompatibility protein [Apiospora arundinis]
MFLAPTDLPRLQLCEVCSSIFSIHVDSSTGKGDPQLIWDGEDHEYSRIRGEIEQEAASGCVFCESVFGDRRYISNEALESGNDHTPLFILETLREYEVENQRRPPWFPPLDETLRIRISYDKVGGILYIAYESIAPSDPASSMVRKGDIMMPPGNPEILKKARGWMDDCITKHPTCRHGGSFRLPRRLIQISSLGEPLWAKMWETNGVNGLYCALSYCWGGDQEHKTIMSCYEQYKEAMPYSKLPKTITDAFHVARTMGMMYIWIDAFCIIQDDRADKEREMSQMMSIYQKALFTISAASASSVTEGFLRAPTDPCGISRLGPYYHPLQVGKDQTGSVMVMPVISDPEPLNRRGWSLQESLLTPRLLIFTDHMTVWKCNEGFQPKCYVPRSNSRIILESPSMNSSDYWRGWQYGKRSLSESRDRLPAISAVAQALNPLFKGDYYAGLWERHLVHELLWYLVPESRHPSFKPALGPSWSWVSIKRRSSISFFSGMAIRAEVIFCETTLVSESNPYGEVSKGVLLIRGYIQPVGIIRRNTPECLFDKYGQQYDGSRVDYDEIPSTPKLHTSAHENDDEHKPMEEAWCLVLTDDPGGVMTDDGDLIPDSNRCQMLVLIKIDSVEVDGELIQFYERVGLATAEAKQPPYWWEANEREVAAIV